MFTTVLKSQAFLTLTLMLFAPFAELAGNAGIHLIDVAADWGFLTPRQLYGNGSRNSFILESTGNGAAIFDFDGDGRNDVLITNGTTIVLKLGEGSGLLLYRPGYPREPGRARR